MRAIDLDNGKEVYLKDYWRPDTEGIEKEGDIYDTLHKKGVRNIASFYCGNDIADQGTSTQDHLSNSLEKFQHYRMALGDVGRPLTTFKSTWELVTAIADAMEAHQDAFEYANILHRDISVGNILITHDGRGMLIDWDLSVNNSNPLSSARRAKRTGTWQFISVSLLLKMSDRHELADDRESAFWVLVWVLLWYSKHNLPSDRLARLLHIFDESDWLDDAVEGGMGKQNVIRDQVLSNMVQFLDHPVLNQLVRDLSDIFSVRYREQPSAESIRNYEEFLSGLMDLPAPAPSLALRDHPVPRHTEAMAALSESRWLVQALREATSKDGWPTDDGAAANITGTAVQGSGQKRKGDSASQPRSSKREKKYKGFNNL